MSAPLDTEDLNHVLKHTQDLWAGVRGHSIFMTGGTGFVGSWLLDTALWAIDKLDLGATVTVLTRRPQRFLERLPHLARHSAVQILEGDAANFDYPDGCYPFVIHAATESSVDSGPTCPLGTFARDLDATRRVLDFAGGHGARRFLFTSSGAVYGRQPSELDHIPESYAGAPPTTDTKSAYGQAKRASEFMTASHSRALGYDATIARLFAFVGPRLPLDAHYAVGNFLGDALRGGPIRIAGDGTPCRSYLYAADLAIWLWTILFRGTAAYPYNVGSAAATTIADLAQTVAAVAMPGAEIRIARPPIPGASPQRYVPSIDRARELGLRPLVSLEEGIRRTANWHRTTVSNDQHSEARIDDK